VISKFIDQAINSKDITIFGDGQQTRTFCFAKDNIETTVNALQENLFVNDIINIGNNEEISILRLAEFIIKLTESTSKIIFLPPLKEGDMTRRLPDISKMKNVLNRNLTSLEDGLNIIINNKKLLWTKKLKI
jgi:UDP-glucose 4-epimerase